MRNEHVQYLEVRLSRFDQPKWEAAITLCSALLDHLIVASQCTSPAYHSLILSLQLLLHCWILWLLCGWTVLVVYQRQRWIQILDLGAVIGHRLQYIAHDILPGNLWGRGTGSLPWECPDPQNVLKLNPLFNDQYNYLVNLGYWIVCNDFYIDKNNQGSCKYRYIFKLP